MAPRKRGLLTLGAGLVLIGLQVMLLGLHVVPRDRPNHIVITGFLVGLGLAIKGGVEAATGLSWRDLGPKRMVVLQWLAFLALVLIGGGIAVFSTIWKC